MIKFFFIVCIGGAIGSLLRYAVALWMNAPQQVFPFATLLVNIAGCFFIGLFYALSEHYRWFTPEYRLFFITGFCGGLTTFSTFALENLKLIQQGHAGLFILYSVGSFATSLVAVLAGMYIIKLL